MECLGNSGDFVGSRIHWTLRADLLSWSVENGLIMDGFRDLVADDSGGKQLS